MDRYEEVAAGLVGDVGPGLEVRRQISPQGLVRGTRIDDLHAGHPLLDEFSEFQSDLQRKGLLINAAVMGPGEFAAVPGIDHHDFHAMRNIPRRNRVCRDDGRRACEEPQQKTCAHI